MYLEVVIIRVLIFGELSPKFPIGQRLATSTNKNKLEKYGLFAIKLTHHY